VRRLRSRRVYLDFALPSLRVQLSSPRPLHLTCHPMERRAALSVRTRKRYPSLERIQRQTPAPSDRPVWARCVFPYVFRRGNFSRSFPFVPRGPRPFAGLFQGAARPYFRKQPSRALLCDPDKLFSDKAIAGCLGPPLTLTRLGAIFVCFRRHRWSRLSGG
jgi:hypothetical protein